MTGHFSIYRGVKTAPTHSEVWQGTARASLLRRVSWVRSSNAA